MSGQSYNLAPRFQFCDSDAEVSGYDSTSICVMFMDTEQEKRINLGKDYPFDPLAGGECIVPSKYQGLSV